MYDIQAYERKRFIFQQKAEATLKKNNAGWANITINIFSLFSSSLVLASPEKPSTVLNFLGTVQELRQSYLPTPLAQTAITRIMAPW